MLKNIYVQCVLLFVLIVGSYALYLNVSYTDPVPEENRQEGREIVTPDPFAGTHIMADGTIMNGDGTLLPDAEILLDGTLKMSDGTILTPAFDLRKKLDAQFPSDTPHQVVIDIVSTNFAYDTEEIIVNKGDEVTINFSSAGGFHDWVIDEFDVATQRIDTGEETSITFVADTVGTFEYYCTVGDHREKGQVGYLTVE
ncbi:MAG: plastocyanin [Candidatus Azotimanducaceae bacterium]|jgi:plastocyanin